jgi:hypothetical protein
LSITICNIAYGPRARQDFLLILGRAGYTRTFFGQFFHTSSVHTEQDKPSVPGDPRNLERVLFQAVGQAGDKACDMIFDLPLRGASAGDEELRTDWATQKIYYLIGRYARQPLASTMEDLDATAKTYRLRIPYRGKF